MTAVITTTATSAAGGGGQNVIGRRRQVFPVRTRADYEEEPISQLLIDAAHGGDLRRALELVSHQSVDVNFIGTVSLKSRKSEVVLNGESASEVRVEFEEFRTDVTALFLAAHNGDVALVRKLLNFGANVNQKLFRGYATTAAVREGHTEVLEMLLNGGAAQPACEEALLEACYSGRAKAAGLLMGKEMIRPHVAVHALVIASCRGFLDFVETLIKNGVDVNANTRVLLQSSKPSLYANVDCNALAAAIVNRQVSIVQLLLKVGCRTDIKVRLGAWSWDTTTGEEFRVGAGLAEPYHATWCAVEYFEASGSILRMLLRHLSPNTPHLGRTILHHAILCGNTRAFDVALSCGADVEFSIQSGGVRAVHLAARLGWAPILSLLTNTGCDLNSKTESGDTALMTCVRHKQEECFNVLASAGCDFGLANVTGQTVVSVAASFKWTRGFQRVVLEIIKSGKTVHSGNPKVFLPLLFVTKANDIEALTTLIKRPCLDLEERDEDGFSAVMVAVVSGYVEAFRLLVGAGADVAAQNKYGETAVSLAEANQNSEAFAKVLSAYACTAGSNSNESSVVHHAVQAGHLDLIRELGKEGCDLNVVDFEGYTPLMLAAKLGNAGMCEVLICCGARSDVRNVRNETALLKNNVILDELARRLVLGGGHVRKHTKGGRGRPHVKVLRMVEGVGVLRWGRSSKRNVVCRSAEVGPAHAFRWNRRRKSDADDQGVFRVVTTKNKEIHFSCPGGMEKAQLWVRGIRLVTRETIFGR